MGEAGKKIADFIKNNFSNMNSISVVVGKGNNGGDGFAAALYLNRCGFNITVFSIYDTQYFSNETSYYYKECSKEGISVIFASDPPSAYDFNCLVIDSILGIGFRGELYENLKNWSKWINRFSIVVSCDIPTGVCSDSGTVSTEAVKADYTIAMGYPKIGSLIEPGKSYSGTIIRLISDFQTKSMS